MKNKFFNFVISALLIGLTMVAFSCEQSEMGPDIFAESIEYGQCCGNIVQGDNIREVQIILNSSTAGFYCTDDKGLTYQFTSINNPEYVITETTSEVDPTFCIGADGHYNLVITHNSSSSPIYYNIVTNTCQP